jgi:hypothetical protein
MKVGVVEAFAHTAMVVNGTSRTSQPHPRLSAIGVTADKRGFWPVMVCPLLTHQRRWLCNAAMVLMPVSAPIKVLV